MSLNRILSRDELLLPPHRILSRTTVSCQAHPPALWEDLTQTFEVLTDLVDCGLAVAEGGAWPGVVGASPKQGKEAMLLALFTGQLWVTEGSQLTTRSHFSLNVTPVTLQKLQTSLVVYQHQAKRLCANSPTLLIFGGKAVSLPAVSRKRSFCKEWWMMRI